MKNDLPIKIDLPEGFLEAETRCGHFVSKEMKEVWAVELDLLSELLRVCKKHNLKIFASDGTLLGAIRHKGFIPWDDDIDMMMFREDYEKLCEVAPKEFKEPYFFQTEHNTAGHIRLLARLINSRTTGIQLEEKNFYAPPFNQGIFIDIFPLDAVIDDKELFAQQCKEAKHYLSKIWKYSSLSSRYDKNATKGLKGAVKAMLYPFTNVLIRKLKLERKAFRKFEDICKRYNHRNTKAVAVFWNGCNTLSQEQKKLRKFNHINTKTVLNSFEKFFIDRRNFEEIIEVPFEFLSIPAGKMYENMLTQRYGDWKKLVKGAAFHDGIFFDARKSYTHYIKCGRK